MEHATIAGIDLRASRIGLGTWPMGGGQWGGTDHEESIRTISAALDLGINFIDTAPACGIGRAEMVVGHAIEAAGFRDRVVISTKVGLERRGDGYAHNSSRTRIVAEVEQSLRRPRTDYIDVCQVHWPDFKTPYEETAEALLALGAHREVHGSAGIERRSTTVEQDPAPSEGGPRGNVARRGTAT